MIRRLPAASAAAVAAVLCCLAGSGFRMVRLIARVERVSVWTVLNTRRSLAFNAWRAALTTGDRVLFGAVGVAAAAGVLAAPYLRPRVASAATRFRAALAARVTRRG
ncbi:hypothetical protein GCM10009839_42420 [Catenulispora yoronensis]|uniref:Uncharacterized protein n=1 Tax=Catenulispora yoronensis TaxID=450799 RepID=A0ABN2UIE1_9ACTN